MRSSQEIREEIAQREDRVDAIIDCAQAEKRDLTDPERSEIDRIQGRGTEGDPDYQAGELAALEADLTRMVAIEKRTLQRARDRQEARGIPLQQQALTNVPTGNVEDGTSRAARVTIPAASRYRYTKLKAYQGPHAEQRAYLAGRFFLATLLNDHGSLTWCQDHGIDTRIRAVLKESANELGGVLVPEELESAIIDLREEYGVFRRFARNVNMMSDTKTVSRRTGGLTTYFVDEAASITESDKAWDNIRLTAKKLAVLTRYTSELGEDAIVSIGDDLTREMAWGFALKEDQCGFLGDGTSTYGGIVGLINAIQSSSTVVAATGNTAFSTLDLTDFEAMIGKLPQYADAGARWYISRAGWASSMQRLVDAGGGNTIRTLEDGSSQIMFLGYPVVISQVMNTVTAAQTSTDGLCYFGDLAMGAAFGNRRGLGIMASEHRYFESDEIGVRGIERFDINVHEVGTTTATDDGTAIIMLQTPAS